VGDHRPALHDSGGKTAHVRVQRVGQPDVTDLRTWGAHERINVRRVTTEEGQPMMRLGRRASLLVAFSLLASAATASAECAWIWWAMTGDTADVAGGYTTKQECERALWTFEAQLKPFPQKVSRLLDGNRLMVTSSQSGKDLATIHSCLPDTVDPRGAKR